jgi:hypothetical protein
MTVKVEIKFQEVDNPPTFPFIGINKHDYSIVLFVSSTYGVTLDPAKSDGSFLGEGLSSVRFNLNDFDVFGGSITLSNKGSNDD